MNEHDTFDPRFLPLAFPAVQMPQIRHAELIAEAERIRALRALPRTSPGQLQRIGAYLLRQTARARAAVTAPETGSLRAPRRAGVPTTGRPEPRPDRPAVPLAAAGERVERSRTTTPRAATVSASGRDRAARDRRLVGAGRRAAR